MANQYINKVIYGGNTIIDLTSDTVTANDVLKNVTFHLPSGATGTGACEYDVDSSDCTAVIAEVLSGKTFAKGGSVLTGTMTNRGAVTGTITTKAGTYTIPQGYHDGSGSVGISSAEQAKIISTNIRQGITILGVEGSMSGTEDVTAETVQNVNGGLKFVAVCGSLSLRQTFLRFFLVGCGLLVFLLKGRQTGLAGLLIGSLSVIGTADDQQDD